MRCLHVFTPLLLASWLIASGCSQDSGPKILKHGDFSAGMTRAVVKEQFGKPVVTNTINKDGEVVWGAIESWWSTIPIGSFVEIWVYDSHYQNNPGRTKLYFLDGSSVVSELAFDPLGVIYEPELSNQQR